MTDVFLHVGLAKTGTTTIQGALEAAAGRLAEEGVLFPGGSHRAQRLAVYDLLGQRVSGEDDARVAGSLGRLVAEIGAHRGPAVVVSEEELSLARPRHVRMLSRALAGHRVVVVVGVRDMARTLVSAWQQTVVNGGTTRWPDFVRSVRGEPGAPPSEGISFWLRHDLLRVVDTWAGAVPVEEVRLVTVPPPGAPSGELLARFGAAAELPAPAWPGERVVARNVSLGAAELEAVRRLNVAVAGSLNTSQHRFVVEAGIRARLAGTSGRPLVLPAEHRTWAQAYGRDLVTELERRGLAVHGCLGDLVPPPLADRDDPPDHVEPADLLAATEAALASLALDHGRLFRRYRRAFAAREGHLPGPVEVLGSEARAAGFRLRKWALHRTDRSAVAAAVARSYVDRTSRSRPGR
ncbi:MAG TPA: hypothetical protein VLK03_06755 [Nocardioides sp.]|nr:hypothetical protein [Nocardioides sp.]